MEYHSVKFKCRKCGETYDLGSGGGECAHESAEQIATGGDGGGSENYSAAPARCLGDTHCFSWIKRDGHSLCVCGDTEVYDVDPVTLKYKWRKTKPADEDAAQ